MIRAEMCIVGAGVAGLNALAAAASYLQPGERVVIVDRRERPGGMWNDTYSYVRLHQPHPFFTVGDMPWARRMPREQLATRSEVLEHLERCAGSLFASLDVRTLLGAEHLGHEEVDELGTTRARVRVRDADGQAVVIDARTCIMAPGYDIRPKRARELSSRSVRSSTPHDEALLGDAAPVYVVGSGKTAMDTVAALAARRPGRELHLIGGSGTVFLDRDIAFPTGARRWVSGRTGLATAADVVMRFDGTNEVEVTTHFRERYGLALVPDATSYWFGILSRGELEAARAALRSVVRGHIEDVVEGPDGPELVLRDGGRRRISEGAWIVDCTGYLDTQNVYEPFRSPGGAVIAITPRSAVHFLTTYGGFLLPHLHFRGLLAELPLYEIDLMELRRRSKAAFGLVTYTLVLYNMLVILGALPPDVFARMGVNLDGWYPLPRRLMDLVHLRRNGARYEAHARAVLDRVAHRFEGLPCGPLATGPHARGAHAA